MKNNKKDLIKKISITIILVMVALTVAYKTVPVIKQYLQHKQNTLSLNKDIKDGSDSIKLMEVTSSPENLSLVVEYKKYYPDEYHIVVMDSKGNEYQKEDAGDVTENIFSTDVTLVYKQIKESKFHSIRILKPKVEGYNPSKLKNVQYVPFNSQLPVSVSAGKNKKITVESINEEDGQFEIIFSSQGIPAYTFASEGGISIYDKTMNKGDRYAYDRVRPEALGNNEYRITVHNTRETYKNNEFVEYSRHIEDTAICIGNYDEMYKEIADVDLD